MTSQLFYASTTEGLRLPIVDVTNSAFDVRIDDQELDELAVQYVREAEGRQQRVTPELLEGLKRSRLGRGLMMASNGFLGGLDTYLLKLGASNLGLEFDPLDRAIAASFPGLTTRLRLQDTAQLIAEGVVPALTERPGCPVVCLNIGGGAGADSWNALLILQASQRGLVDGRDVVIAVLDLEPAGPAFGVSAVEVLSQDGAPLHSLAVRFQHVSYDWSNSGVLRGILATLPPDAVCAVSSEGALFEYGSDQEIVDNLRELRVAVPPPALVVGSVTRDSEATRASRASTRVTTIPRSLDAFHELAAGAGWLVESAVTRPFAYSVRLVPRW